MAQQNSAEALRELQCEYITSHFAKLVEITEVTPSVIAIFKQERVLSSGDVSKLDAISSRHAKNLEFYNTIVNRTGFYKVLITAMKETCQIGVVNLLNQLDVGQRKKDIDVNINNHYRTPDFEAIIVGTGDCPTSKVSSILCRPDHLGVLTEKWSQVARELQTPNHQIINIRQRLTLNMFAMNDAVYEILEHWVGRCGQNAALQKLLQVLEENCLKNCSEALQSEFFHQHNSEEDPDPKMFDK